MKTTLHVIFIFVLSVLGCRNVYAQNSIKHFTIEDGLPSNEVHFVHQDDNGYYWFCTDAGISRYNGYEFTNFTIADGLTNNVVFKCFEDWDGNLWFTCIDGSITIYNQKKKEFTKYENSDWLRSKYSLQKWTHHIGFREKTQEVWFFMLINLHKGSAIYSVDKNGQRDSTIISDFRFKVHSKFDNFHIIKFRRVMEVGFFVPVLEASLPLSLNYEQIIDANENLYHTYPAFTEFDKKLYAATNGGVYELFKKKPPRVILGGVASTSLLRDKSRLLWITTANKGIFVVASNRTKAISKKLALKKNEKITIAKGLRGGVVLGTNQSRLLLLDTFDNARSLPYKSLCMSEFPNLFYNKDSSSLSFADLIVENVNGVYSNRIIDMWKFDAERFLVTWDGAIRSSNYMSRSRTNTLGQYAASLMRLYGDSFIRWSIENDKLDEIRHLVVHRILPKYYVSKEYAYLATNKGLVKLFTDNRKSKIVDLGLKYKPYLICDLDTLCGFTLLATNGQGILTIKEDSIFSIISTETGLVSDIVNAFYLDKKMKTMWCATSEGISIYRYVIRNNKLQFFWLKNILKGDGLVSKSINDIEIMSDRVYAISDQGITIIPEDFVTVNSPPPPVVLLGYKNGDSTYSSLNEHFAYNHNNIEFRYEAVINTKAMGTYQYRLVGSKDSVDWTVTDDRSVSINNIAPDTYVFQVRTRRANSEWGVPSQYSFTIEKRFADRVWVRALIAVILISIGYLMFAGALRRLRKQDKLLFSNQELEWQVAKLESSSLRRQMNPHLIFNVLNSIQKLILKEEKDDANKRLAHFSEFVRASLRYSRFEYISLEDEVAFLKNYMDIEAQRFPERFSYTIDVAEELFADVTLPPLLIQPLCENCIKHAFVEDGGTIAVRIRVENEDRLHIEVEDDGIGIYNTNTLKKSSLGTTIIQDRLKLMQKSGRIASLKIESADKNTDKGTKATLILSYN